MSKLEEPSRRGGQDFRSICMNGNFIFEANSAHAFHINSRFQGHHVARTNFLLLASSNSRPFVDFNAEAMSRAMHEIRSQATLIEKTPRRPVNASGGDTRPESILRRFLGLLYRFVPLADASRRAAQKKGARQVTAVVAEDSTQVQHHQFFFLQSPFGRPRVRQSRTRAGSDDRLEGRTTRAFAAQTVVDLGGNLQFSHTGTNE